MDFRRTRNKPNTAEEVEVGDDYRCLGVYRESRLDWKCNTEAVYKKEHNRLCLRKLKSFNLCTKMLHIFHKQNESQRLKGTEQTVKEGSGSVLGTALEWIEKRRRLRKLTNIKNNTFHPSVVSMRLLRDAGGHSYQQQACNDC